MPLCACRHAGQTGLPPLSRSLPLPDFYAQLPLSVGRSPTGGGRSHREGRPAPETAVPRSEAGDGQGRARWVSATDKHPRQLSSLPSPLARSEAQL